MGEKRTVAPAVLETVEAGDLRRMLNVAVRCTFIRKSSSRLPRFKKTN